MTIVGFSYNKINVEKKQGQGGKVNISNNVAIKDVKEADLNLGNEKQKAIKFEFEFTSKYDPNIGKILLGGDVLFLTDKAKSTKILDEWKKDKTVEKVLMSEILNSVLSRCNVQALILSQDVSLPSPIPLPKVKIDGQKEPK